MFDEVHDQKRSGLGFERNWLEFRRRRYLYVGPLVDDGLSWCGRSVNRGNSKCGNKYLAWAFVQAAHFAVRYNPRINRFYERKAAKTNKKRPVEARNTAAASVN